MTWFYFVDPEGLPHWRGARELLRLSSVISRQRSFTILGRRFFVGPTEVEVELIWQWGTRPPT